MEFFRRKRQILWPAGLALFALALGTAPAPAQSQDWADKMFRANGGSAAHDFGNQPRGAQLFHAFKMTNIWAVPIEIVGVRAECACVTATPSAQVLKPREEGTLNITMDTRRFAGPKTVHIYITIGPEYVSTATVQVSAHSRTDVVFNPGQVNFGVVNAGQTPAHTIDVEYAGALDWRVTEIVKNEAPLEAKLEEMYRRPGPVNQIGYRIHASLKADAPPGMHVWELHLKTNDPASPLVSVLVSATVQRSLTVAPAQVNLRSLKVGETASQRVVVRGSKPFKIVAVDGLDESIQVDYPTAAAQVQIVTIKCQPSQPGELRRQLHIKTDSETESSVTVTIETEVVP